MSEKIFSEGNQEDWPVQVIIYTDGASRGNPGPASLGFTVTGPNGTAVYDYAEALGEQTNNVAEYTAVLRALRMAVVNKVQDLTLRSDSQLLIRQLIGEYKVKAPGLRPLFLECRKFAEQIPTVKFEHVRREFNQRADELANYILDM